MCADCLTVSLISPPTLYCECVQTALQLVSLVLPRIIVNVCKHQTPGIQAIPSFILLGSVPASQQLDYFS